MIVFQSRAARVIPPRIIFEDENVVVSDTESFNRALRE